MTPLPLSIFIITLNEADRIAPVLHAALQLSDDVIVVDSGSTDGTVALCQQLGARVIHHDFTGYGAQKRFAEDQCRHEWLLNIDADEVMPPALLVEIRAAIISGSSLAYTIPIAEVFPGESMPHPFAYTLKPVRLYHKSIGRYNPSPVHDRVDVAQGTRISHLKSAIHHFSVRSMGDQIAKLNRYSDRQADDLDARGVHIPGWRVLFEFPAAFFKAFILRRHCLRGVYGYVTSVNYAFSRHLRIAKHLERRWKRG